MPIPVRFFPNPIGLLVFLLAVAVSASAADRFTGLSEINPPASPPAGAVTAIVGATLIDGCGGPPVPDSTVLIRGDRIAVAGPRASVGIPADAHRIDATGLTLLPGLIDAHFHIGSNTKTMFDLPPVFLSHGVTTARDPGRPIEVYQPVRTSDKPMPRLFLTGPHFDQAPPAWPQNAIVLESPDQASRAVQRYRAQGASGIKVYFRLSLESIKSTCRTAHEIGIPVTAHLELVDADIAIRAGLDGVEHITSFGTALADPGVAEKFRKAVDRDNEARQDGRYRLWASLDLDHSPRAESLLQLLGERKIFVSPTLAVFERRAGDKKSTEPAHVAGFANMLKFTGMCARAGAIVVVGSHTWVPHAESGWAFQREMELLVESGLSPMETIAAATLRNARFLGCADRLGSIETGKLADLVLIGRDPIKDIRALYDIRRVMQNGRWVAGD